MFSDDGNNLLERFTGLIFLCYGLQKRNRVDSRSTSQGIINPAITRKLRRVRQICKQLPDALIRFLISERKNGCQTDLGIYITVTFVSQYGRHGLISSR